MPVVATWRGGVCRATLVRPAAQAGLVLAIRVVAASAGRRSLLTAPLASIALNDAVPLANRQAVDLLVVSLTIGRKQPENRAFIGWPEVDVKWLLNLHVARQGICQNAGSGRFIGTVLVVDIPIAKKRCPSRPPPEHPGQTGYPIVEQAHRQHRV